MRRSVGYVLEGGSRAWCDAMHELEQILSIKGIDMVQFGPSDYSISIGMPGQGRAEAVQQAHRRVIETALMVGVHPRVEVGSFEQTKPYLDMGVRHFCIGWNCAPSLPGARSRARA